MTIESISDVSVSSRVLRKQVDLLYSNQPFALFATVMVTYLLFVHLGLSIGYDLAMKWAALFTGVFVYRAVSTSIYVKNKKNRKLNVKQSEIIYTIGIILTGISWALFAVKTFPLLDYTNQVFIFIIYLGISAAAHTTMGYLKTPSYSHTSLLMLSLIVGINIADMPNKQLITLALLVYYFFILRASSIFYANTRNMLELHEVSIDREHVLLLQRAEADAANLAKTEFLSRMSHEIRTPLNAMLCLNELQLYDKSSHLTEKQSARVRKIDDAGKHLLSIVNDALDFSRIDAGVLDVNLELVDCQNVIDDAIKMLEGKALLRNIVFKNKTYGSSLYVKADAIRLRQVIVNLIDNAVKYNKDNGTVSVVSEKVNDETVRVSISDTGNGINQALIGDLFKPFSRLGADASGVDGTGIGLNLSKRLATLMNGNIGMRNEPPGCCFWIELPCMKKESVSAVDNKQAVVLAKSGINRCQKLLLVDDNLVNCEVAVDMLEVLGFEVDVANNGEQALEIYDRAEHALILMDCEMPVMNGFVTTEKIRANEAALNQSPKTIIALTAHAIKGAKETCLASGMNDFISKPFTLSVLQTVLTKWLESMDNNMRALESSDDDIDVQFIDNMADARNDVLSVLDSNVLRQLSMRKNNTGVNLLHHVVELYLSQSTTLLNELSEAVNGQDVETVRAVSHALKSSSENVGAKRLSELCGKLETHCMGDVIESVLVEQVLQTYPVVEKAFNEILKGNDDFMLAEFDD